MDNEVTFEEALRQLSPGVGARMRRVRMEIESILHEAQGLITAGLSDRISFRYENAAEGPDLLTPFQRAQSISFVTRFDHLPPNAGVAVAGDPAGGFIIANMADVRHVLHEYRPILQNQHDSVYHQKLHSTWRRMLLGRDAAKGTVVTVLDHDKNDITPKFVTWMDQSHKALGRVLRSLDFGYLYNGFLQHSDSQYTDRFLDEYVSGELNYTLMKHVAALGFIKDRLLPYYFMAGALVFPRLGHLPGDDPAG
jgi:hypothetical protein